MEDTELMQVAMDRGVGLFVQQVLMEEIFLGRTEMYNCPWTMDTLGPAMSSYISRYVYKSSCLNTKLVVIGFTVKRQNIIDKLLIVWTPPRQRSLVTLTEFFQWLWERLKMASWAEQRNIFWGIMHHLFSCGAMVLWHSIDLYRLFRRPNL